MVPSASFGCTQYTISSKFAILKKCWQGVLTPEYAETLIPHPLVLKHYIYVTHERVKKIQQVQRNRPPWTATEGKMFISLCE